MRNHRIPNAVVVLMLAGFISGAQAQAPSQEPPAPSAGKQFQPLFSAYNKQQAAKQWKEAEDTMQHAVTLAKQTHDIVGEAWCLRTLALAQIYQYHDKEAYETAKLASAVWKPLNDGPEYIETLVMQAIAEPQQAPQLLKQVQELCFAETKRPRASATVLNYIGFLFVERKRTMDARICLQAALALREKWMPNTLELGQMLSSFGLAEKNLQHYTEAEGYYQRAITLYTKIVPNSLNVANTLLDLGIVYEQQARLNRAAECYGQAREIYTKLAPDSLNMAKDLYRLGDVSLERGELAAAEDCLRRALTIFQKLAPDSELVAGVLNSLGTVAMKRRDLNAAEAYYKQAHLLHEKLAPDSMDVADSLHNLGDIAFNRGDFAQAEKYLSQAVGLREKLDPDSLHTAHDYNSLGNIAWKQRQLAAAQTYYQRALKIYTQHVPDSMLIAGSFQNLGNIADQQHDPGTAEKYWNQCLDIRTKLAPDSLDTASILHSLSSLAQSRHDNTTALKLAQRAWNITRQQSGTIAGDEARQAFGETAANYAERLLFCHLLQKQKEAAFLTLEQARAQALQQLQTDRRLLSTAPQNTALWNGYATAVQQRDQALAALSNASAAQAQARVKLRRSQDQSAPQAPMDVLRESLAAADNAFAQKQSAYQQARVEADAAWNNLKKTLPQIVAPEMATTQMQQSLPDDTLFVAYMVEKPSGAFSGAGVCYLFWMQRTGPVEVTLLPATSAMLERKVNELREEMADRNSDPELLAAHSRALYNVVFPPPIRRQITSAPRLLLSPDGPLWSLSFAALISNAEGVPSYLGTEKPLAFTQSLAVFANARNAPHPVPSGRLNAVVLGDPVFDLRTPVKNVNGKALPSDKTSAASIPPLPASRSDRRGLLWDNDSLPERLPATREEAVAVAGLYHASPLLGEAATEANLRKRLASADIIHLATHGYLHPKLPLASGVLLTPPSVESPIAQTDNDGALQAWEVLNLKMKADLVVLSACETGRGQNVSSEGVVGLTRALQYAGCRSIVASQWAVQDASTEALMIAFHAGLQRGLAKDEALRSAMKQVQSHAGTAHPAHWAAFFLTGDPANISQRQPASVHAKTP